MTDKITVACPECSARLSVPDSKLGKKIKCPKCDETFTAEPTDDMDELEEVDDDFPETDDEPKRRKSGGGKKSGKKGKKSESSGVMGLVLFGVVGFLVLVTVALFAFVFNKRPARPDPTVVAEKEAPTEPVVASQSKSEKIEPAKPAAPVASDMSAAEKMLGLRWLPANTELIVHAKLAEIMRAPLLKGPLSDAGFKQGLETFQKQTGMSVENIESVTVGISHFEQIIAQGAQANFGGMNSPLAAADQHAIVVIKTKNPVDVKSIAVAKPEAQLKESNGKSYYETPATAVEPAGGWWSPEPNTFISGTIKELLGTLAQGETVVPRKEFASIDESPQLIIAAVIPDLQSDTKASVLESQPWFASARDTMKPYSPKLATLGLTVKGGFDLQVGLLSATSEGTANAKKEIESQIAQAKTMFGEYQKSAPPLFAELGEMLLTNLKVDEKDKVVRVSTSIPDDAQAKLEQVPPILMMMAMTGGFGPGPSATSAANSLADTNRVPVDAEAKMPGESGSVAPSEPPEGLEEGMTITAKSAWSVAPAVSQEQVPVKAIDLMIDLKGPGLDRICGSAGIIPKTITSESGETLKRSRLNLPQGTLPDTAFRVFESGLNASEGDPPQTLRVKMTVDAPKKTAKTIEVFEGTFRYLIAEETEEISIADPIQTSKRPSNDALKDGGIKLQYYPPENNNPPWLGLSCGKGYFIGHVTGTPADITSKSIMIGKDRMVQQVTSKGEKGSFPDNLVLTFNLYSKLREHVVKFKFENVPLPEGDASIFASGTKDAAEMPLAPAAPKIERKKKTGTSNQPDTKN